MQHSWLHVNLGEGSKYSFALRAGSSPSRPGEGSLVFSLPKAGRVGGASPPAMAAKRQWGPSGSWWPSLDSDSASAQGFPTWSDPWQRACRDREPLRDASPGDGYTSLRSRCPLCKSPWREKAALISALANEKHSRVPAAGPPAQGEARLRGSAEAAALRAALPRALRPACSPPALQEELQREPEHRAQRAEGEERAASPCALPKSKI